MSVDRLESKTKVPIASGEIKNFRRERRINFCLLSIFSRKGAARNGWSYACATTMVGAEAFPQGLPALYFFKLIKLLGFSAGCFGFLSSESYFEKISSQCFGQKGRKKRGRTDCTSCVVFRVFISRTSPRSDFHLGAVKHSSVKRLSDLTNKQPPNRLTIRN